MIKCECFFVVFTLLLQSFPILLLYRLFCIFKVVSGRICYKRITSGALSAVILNQRQISQTKLDMGWNVWYVTERSRPLVKSVWTTRERKLTSIYQYMYMFVDTRWSIIGCEQNFKVFSTATHLIDFCMWYCMQSHWDSFY